MESDAIRKQVSPMGLGDKISNKAEELKGKGVGRALVEALVADARASGYKVIPLCPFVKAQYGRHPEWSDVFG